MAVLSNDELNVIRENAKCNVTDNDMWGNETVVSLINTIEAQQQKIEQLEKLKELTENLKELTARHIFHKMTPSTCSIPIQVFENREEWLEFARVNFAITKLLGESEVGEG